MQVVYIARVANFEGKLKMTGVQALNFNGSNRTISISSSTKHYHYSCKYTTNEICYLSQMIEISP